MLQTILRDYALILSWFPTAWHGPISLILTLLIAGGIWQVLRKNGIWLVLLLILVPALIPTAHDVALTVISLLKALINQASV